MEKPARLQNIQVVLLPPHGRAKFSYVNGDEPDYPYSTMRGYKRLRDEYQPQTWTVTNVGTKYFYAMSPEMMRNGRSKPVKFNIDDWSEVGETYGRRHVAFKSIEDYIRKMKQRDLDTLYRDAVLFLSNKSLYRDHEPLTEDEKRTIIRIVNRVHGVDE